MKLWWSLLIAAFALPMIISPAAGAANAGETDLWEDDDADKEVLVRTIRGANRERASGGSSPSCRYIKGQWSECDPKTNMRTRTLTLKKGDKTCEQNKTITKKCKKACRYEKGSWSSCTNQNMARVDTIKPNSDPSCEKTRRITKRCKPEANNKKATKDRSNKKANKQQ